MTEEKMMSILSEKENELKSLRKRVGDQRKEISRLREISDHIVTCRECQYCKGYENGAHYCERDPFVSFGVLTQDFCSRGERLPILDMLQINLR